MVYCSAKTKKHDDKKKKEAKGKSHVNLSTGVRNLSKEFKDFSSNNTNEVNAASTPVPVVEPNSTDSTNTFSVVGPLNNAVSLNFKLGGKSSFVDPSQYPDDPNMPALEDITYSDDEEDVGAEADFSNLETMIVKRIFRYLKVKPHLGLWYPKHSPFNLVAYFDSDYAGASLDRKSTTRGCQFLGCRLISWQCKKQIVVATSSTEAEYVAATSCYAQVLWIQN
nr:uncharacterized mitochondrial protein AtMg00810-like [Tanacetum cinerariifolium]